MRLRRLTTTAMLIAATTAIGACGTPGGSSSNNDSDSKETASQPVKKDGFSGELRVVSSEGSGGPRDALIAQTKAFEAANPGVTVKLSFRSFDEWIKAVRLQLQGSNPPDVVAGNQGYQVDGAIVKAGLVEPLDRYAAAYGWNDWYSPQSLQQFKWTKDGQFGTGQLWGIAQTGQNVGIFVNTKKAQELGIDPASLTSFDDLQAALQKARGELPKSEPVIALGNKDQYPALHMWGLIQGAYEDPQAARDWIFHADGATFDTDGNKEALNVLKQWGDDDYLGSSDDYNGRDENAAAIAFGKGTGLFFMGGNWNAATIKDGLGEDNVTYLNGPPGSSGKDVAIGATSVPYHISSKSKQKDLAAAYIGYISSPENAKDLVDENLVPAAVGANAQPTTTYGKDIQSGWEQLVKDGGLTFFPDWTSPTMYETIGQNFQELLTDRKSTDQVVEAIQADWTKYGEQLKR